MIKGIIFASFAAFLLIYFLAMALKPSKESIEDRVKRLAAEKQATNQPKKRRTIKDILSLFAKLTPRKWAAKVDKELKSSGVSLSGGEFIIFQTFLVILFSLIALMLLSVNLIVIFLPLLSVMIPQLYIKQARNKRIRQFNNQLADVLLTLANSLKAGFSLFQAMEMSSQEMPDPISTELRITLKEMAYGESTESALTNLTDRIKSRDLDLMITAILIQRQIGGNLAEILLGIHETIQDRIRLQGQIKTLTAQGRLSGYLIGALPFFIGLIITVMEPSYILTLFNSPLGIMMLSFGLFFQVLGFLTIKKIINIKY